MLTEDPKITKITKTKGCTGLSAGAPELLQEALDLGADPEALAGLPGFPDKRPVLKVPKISKDSRVVSPCVGCYSLQFLYSKLLSIAM